MKITEGQLTVLLQTTVESLKFFGDARGLFTFSADVRRAVAQEVLDSQTEVLMVSRDPVPSEPAGVTSGSQGGKPG